MDIQCSTRFRRLVHSMLWAVAMSVAFGQLALHAQQPPAPGYKTIPLPKELENRTNVAKLKNIKFLVLNGRAVLAENQDSLVKWYRDYQFRRFTLPEYAHELAKIRADLERDIRSARVPEVHQFLLNTYFNYATKLCTGDYYPATRVNAMLLIAGLNQSEENLGQRLLPVPYAPSLPFMLDQLRDPKQIDAIKAVSLVGIRRHVQLALVNPAYSISAAQRDSILQSARSIIQQLQPPESRSAAGHAWMQRRAMETAVLVADLKKDQALLDELAAILNQDTTDPSLVCATARAIGHLRVPQGVQYDPLPLTQRLGQWVVKAVDREIDRVAAEKAAEKAASGDTLGGLGGLGGMEGYESGGDDEPQDAGGNDPYGNLGGDEKEDDTSRSKDAPKSPPGVLRTRRVLKYQFMCILEGMTGPPKSTNMGIAGLVAADAAKKNEVKKIHDAIRAILDATDPADATKSFKDEDELLNAVQAKLADLVALLPQPAPPEESADDAAADPGDAPGGATPDNGDQPNGDQPGQPPKPGNDQPGADDGGKKNG